MMVISSKLFWKLPSSLRRALASQHSYVAMPHPIQPQR